MFFTGDYKLYYSKNVAIFLIKRLLRKLFHSFVKDQSITQYTNDFIGDGAIETLLEDLKGKNK